MLTGLTKCVLVVEPILDFSVDVAYFVKFNVLFNTRSAVVCCGAEAKAESYTFRVISLSPPFADRNRFHIGCSDLSPPLGGNFCSPKVLLASNFVVASKYSGGERGFDVFQCHTREECSA